jgi:hypothetical protein
VVFPRGSVTYDNPVHCVAGAADYGSLGGWATGYKRTAGYNSAPDGHAERGCACERDGSGQSEHDAATDHDWAADTDHDQGRRPRNPKHASDDYGRNSTKWNWPDARNPGNKSADRDPQ